MYHAVGQEATQLPIGLTPLYVSKYLSEGQTCTH